MKSLYKLIALKTSSSSSAGVAASAPDPSLASSSIVQSVPATAESDALLWSFISKLSRYEPGLVELIVTHMGALAFAKSLPQRSPTIERFLTNRYGINPEQLAQIRQLQSTGPVMWPRLYSNGNAFVAVLDNGELLAWGDPVRGGRTPVLPEGRTVQSVHSNGGAFIAVLDNGELLAWGNTDFGATVPEALDPSRIARLY